MPRSPETCLGMSCISSRVREDIRWGADGVHVSSQTLHVKRFSYPEAQPRILKDVITEGNPLKKIMPRSVVCFQIHPKTDVPKTVLCL